MSKQLAISSAFSVLATAALALFASAEGDDPRVQFDAQKITGTSIEVEAPAIFKLPAQLPAAPSLKVFAD